MGQDQEKTNSYLKREVPGLVLVFLALILFLALGSYHEKDISLISYSTAEAGQQVRNMTGVAGAHAASYLFLALGLTAFLFPLILLAWGLRLLGGAPARPSWARPLGLVLLFFSLAALLSLGQPRPALFSRLPLDGGLVGQAAARALVHLLNRPGAVIVLALVLILALNLGAGLSLIRLARSLGRGALKALAFARARRLKRRERRTRGRRLKKLLTAQREQPAPSIKKTKPKAKEKPVQRQERFEWVDENGSYRTPPLDLLDQVNKEAGGMSQPALVASSRLLEKKLADFGVEGRVVEVSSGPVITMFEYEPAAGVKISKVAGLADDLALNMKAVSVRIVAPLPGKAVIGIELPNPRREIVYLREIVDSEEFNQSSSLLTLVMGVDIMGQPVTADLRKMPHLLIAGATGSGKSVGLNAIIISILYKAAPDQVRFLMIDPKRIELSPYNDLPHLIYPVISDPKLAKEALRWAVAEMEGRYKLLADQGVRNIEAYNKKLAAEQARAHKKDPGQEHDGGEEPAPEPEPLPYLVIIIDELADLMMVSAREVEESITRLSQMARAAGIHLILATQRPSVDVLTGIIKANMPTRVSFQVTSKTDSRTILDTNGAENLLGNGDMLFMPPQSARLTRLHGAFVSEAEISRVTRFIKAQKEPEYLDELKPPPAGPGEAEADEYDEKYDEAVEFVTSTGRASISAIQRQFRIGYNRAARIIETMERDGVVSQADGAKPRKVLAKGYE